MDFMILTEAFLERTPDWARNLFSGNIPTAAGVCLGQEKDSGRTWSHFTVVALKGRHLLPPGASDTLALHTA